jgi:hypothetical protein
MTIPSWPVSYRPDLNSISGIKRLLDPLATDMEGGNTRLRSRPGDNVGTLSQTIIMKKAEFDTFVAWVKDTLGNGTARFMLKVRLGTTFEEKVCQFSGGAPTYRPVGSGAVAVTMTLRVYDV